MKQDPYCRFGLYMPPKQIAYALRARKYYVFHYTFNLEIYHVETFMYLCLQTVMKKLSLIFTDQ